MTSKEIIKEIMKNKNVSNASMAKDLGMTQAALWERLNSKKSDNLSINSLNEMLDILGYEVVIVPTGSADKIRGAYMTCENHPRSLYDYILTSENDEIPVLDTEYDIETYFYKDTVENPKDVWDNSIMELSKKLKVIEETKNGKVVVNLSDTIEKNINSMSKLFKSTDIDDIMGDIEAILAGNVPESWMKNFVDTIKN